MISRLSRVTTALFLLSAPALAQDYQSWGESTLPALYQNSSEFEILVHRMKTAEHQREPVQALKGRAERAQYAMLVSAVPDAVFSPLLKRLLLGATLIEAGPRRDQAIEYFVKLDAQMAELFLESTGRGARKRILKSLSDGFLEFQKIAGGDEAFLKSVLRIILMSDPVMQKWMTKALKQSTGFPKRVVLRQAGYVLTEFPLLLITTPLFGGGIVATAVQHGSVHPNMALMGALMTAAGLMLNSNRSPEQKRLIWQELPRLAREGRTYEQQRKMLLGYLQNDCTDLLTDGL